jgi:hypothetical protein
VPKSLDSFDFAAIPSLNKTLVLELARSEYVTRRENIIAAGRPARRGCQLASTLLRRSSMNCWRLATRSGYFASISWK